MHKIIKKMAAAACLATLVAGITTSPAVQAADSTSTMKSALEEGKAIADNRKLGNCLACHMVAGATLPGTIGPPLVGMKARYPDKAKLRAQIWDATKANAESPMPPFGRNHILTEEQIDKVVDYIWTL